MDVTITQAKSQLTELVGLLEDGEENQIVITRKGKPVAKLMDYNAIPSSRRLGIAEGKFTVSDDWDEEDKEIAKLFGVM